MSFEGLSQDELQTKVLAFMYEQANESAQRQSAAYVAAVMGLPDARVAMALSRLEREKLMSASHNSMSGSHYIISELGYREVEKGRLAPGHDSSIPIPAAGRIVTLDHNQRASLEEAADNLITNLKESNAIDGDNDLRDRFIAQVHAARELVRAHSVRAYLFYMLVVETLSKLIATYGKATLGVAATKLLELYIEHLVGHP